MHGSGMTEMIVVVFQLSLLGLMVAGGWKMLEKANQPGWGVLIPAYNLVLALRLAGKPIWWIILLFIPIVNFFVGVAVAVAISRNFGKGFLFGLGLLFLPYIFCPILGFGRAEYVPAGLPSMDQLGADPRAAAIR